MKKINATLTDNESNSVPRVEIESTIPYHRGKDRYCVNTPLQILI